MNILEPRNEEINAKNIIATKNAAYENENSAK